MDYHRFAEFESSENKIDKRYRNLRNLFLIVSNFDLSFKFLASAYVVYVHSKRRKRRKKRKKLNSKSPEADLDPNLH